jgi:hypothetical protein
MPRERTIGFADELGQLDRAGAVSLNRAYGDADEQHHEEVAQFYQQLHAEIEMAKEQRQMTMDRAKTERRLRYEQQMTKAIPELYSIDPSSPDAPKQRAAFAAKYPELFHKEKDIPSIVEEFGQHVRIGQQSEMERQRIAEDNQKTLDRERLQDKREAATAERSEKSQAAIADRMEKTETAKEAARKAAEDAKEQKALTNAKLAHGTASAKVDELQSRLDKNREYREAEKDPGKQDLLDKSFQELQKQHDAAAMTKNILETVHPEILIPDAQPAAKTDAQPVSTPPVTSPAVTPPADSVAPSIAAPAEAPVGEDALEQAAPPPEISPAAVTTPVTTPVTAPVATPATADQTATSGGGDFSEPDKPLGVVKTGDDDPRMILAKKALGDPAATEAHRAAARKILGLPEPGVANAQ